ncbi:hypothetical protein LTR78_001023 [Recurvomyces mirabilis]|uniref:MIF4G domain-containing protein n=1 Tax=Recurvomyces mirabilis TaxID=574656 RepID=A0AAE1C619_9PEZI|nr:hypothetical protein LTR78_001023 [Recurvomyces mirabilis]KAK5158995.1 hypothetical protein LTS14_003103 [Recurvomyces mirabilis]
MTSAIAPSAQAPPPHATTDAQHTASGTTSPLPGAVPAQLPARSYATATKTASPASQTPAGASTQNAKSTDSPVNGAHPIAHGGSQPNGANSNNTPADHARKPSVVISAAGASGSIPNGGPVSVNGRPHINFGAMNVSPLPQHAAPFQAQNASLSTPGSNNPRVISPAHSPSPIPQPQASGGRPPAGLQNQTNGVTFGQLGGEGEQFRQNQPPLGPGMPSMHERRQSSHSDMSNSNMQQNMNRNFMPPGGRGRGFPNQPYGGMPSPGPNYRSMSGQQATRPNMPPQFQPGPQPGSPFMRSGSPAVNHPRPSMPSYGYSHQQVNITHFPVSSPTSQSKCPGTLRRATAPFRRTDIPLQLVITFPTDEAADNSNKAKRELTHIFKQMQYDPQYAYNGYYQPYYNGYPGQPPQSPRPPYPSPYQAPGGPMPAPFNPPDMSRSASQTSQRPPSSLGQPPTPSMQNQAPSHTPGPSQPAQPSQSSNFVRPVKKSNAIKITDSQGNEVNFNKSAPSPGAAAQPQPQTPVIVSTPNAPTPPPRVPSAQHNRVESKSTKSSEETKNAFQEQVRRNLEEAKRREQDSEAKKSKVEAPAKEDSKTEVKTTAPVEADKDEPGPPAAATQEPVKEAAAAAEKSTATAAKDEEGVKAADAAEAAVSKPVEEQTEKEETEDERMEREIAEMEAADKAEAEREAAFQEKRQKEKAESAKRQAETDAKADEELKRQEREAEEREEARERERRGETEEKDKDAEEPDDEAKAMFASLKKPALGPGAPAPESGAETSVSEDAPADSSAMPPPSQPAAKHPGAQKPKPAHLKLETNKRVEPAEPTPGMQALKSARFLAVNEELKYPDGFKSPNPALNDAGARKGKAYDRDFLLQFQNVFKEKPSVHWEQKIKETLGSDEPASARLGSARTPSTRQPSGRGPAPMGGYVAMGQFAGGARTLPPGTSSADRFAASSGAGRGGMAMPQMGGRAPSQLGMGAPMGMSRTNSLQTMGNMGGPNSPRQPSGRGGRGASKRGMSKKEEQDAMAKMPLTAHMEIAPLPKSTSGWKPTSISAAPMAAPDLSGNLAPDIVQRKVKAALNKMTPEKFDKIADQILEIASQSKNETDGRTLRQVIQLTFEKATDEAHWAGMYAKFCHKMLTTMSTDIKDETIRDKNGNPVVGGALFRKYLLNRCQEEFERGWQANLPEKPEGDSQEAALLSDEYYVAAAAKRRGLGLIQFIGQLYKLKMLTLRIMHECVMRLLNFEGEIDDAAVENLTTLLRAVGGTMEEDDQGSPLLNTYFQRIDQVFLKNETLASRPRFMIMDLIDLRKAGWKGKDDTKGPKTLDQVHAEAAAAIAKADAERARTNQRGGPGGGRMPAGRGDARNFSGNMPPPADYNRNVQMDDLRKLQNRGASNRQAGGSLAPGGGLGPSALSGRQGSRRGNLGPSSSGNTTRTNTPPVDKDKKEEPTQQNSFSALAALENEDSTAPPEDTASPPTARNRSKSPLPAAERTEG